MASELSDDAIDYFRSLALSCGDGGRFIYRAAFKQLFDEPAFEQCVLRKPSVVS